MRTYVRATTDVRAYIRTVRMYVRTHVRVSVGDMGVSGIRTYVRTYARAFAQDVLVGTCVYTHKRTAQVLVRVRANVRTVCIVRKCACEGDRKSVV